MTRNSFKMAIALGALAVFAPNVATAGDAPKKGSKTFTIHYVYHPIGYSEVPGVGKITTLESSGQAADMKGESVAFTGALKSKCQMVSIESAGKAWTEGGCVVTDGDGDLFFATFDSRTPRGADKALDKMDCGSYVDTGGTGKFKGFSATGAYSCAMADAPKGEPAGSFAMDISHVENWQMTDVAAAAH